MRNYEKGFDYDIVGNLLETKHQAGATSWKRLYEYESPSTLDSDDMDNRLTKTTVGSDETAYGYDVHGNMIDTAHLSKMEWGFKDQLFASAKQEVNNGDPETTYYVYDAGGQRVRKVTEREDSNGSGDSNRKHERIYLGDFEVYREYENDDQEPVEKERKTLHVSDDHSRIALIETKTVDESQAVTEPEPLVRHQLGDHLQSSSVELDEAGNIISYEGYYPYGSTSYQAVDGDTEVSAKRYRYTGKERDEETGFYYHGARYYAPWLCRWTAPDPAGMVDGVNLYEYVQGNPVKLRDPDGMESDGAGEPIPLQDARAADATELRDAGVAITNDYVRRQLISGYREAFQQGREPVFAITRREVSANPLVDSMERREEHGSRDLDWEMDVRFLSYEDHLEWATDRVIEEMDDSVADPLEFVRQVGDFMRTRAPGDEYLLTKLELSHNEEVIGTGHGHPGGDRHPSIIDLTRMMTGLGFSEEELEAMTREERIEAEEAGLEIIATEEEAFVSVAMPGAKELARELSEEGRDIENHIRTRVKLRMEIHEYSEEEAFRDVVDNIGITTVPIDETSQEQGHDNR